MSTDGNGARASFTLANAATLDADGLLDVVVRDGQVDRLAPAGSTVAAGERLDLRGQLLVPGFADLHVHLDKAFQLPELDARGLAGGGLADALAATAQLRPQLTLEVLRRNALRVIDTMTAGGTVAARAHVEISEQASPDLVRLHAEIAAERPGFVLELCAFPQHGTTSSRTLERAMERALNEGCTVVGGCPYADPEPLRHLAYVVALAKDTGLPLDLHLDLSDDPAEVLLHEVAESVLRAGIAGRVVVGHETALTALDRRRLNQVVAMTAAAGITVVSIPTTDLFLSGRGDAAAPTRGVTRIRELWAAGVPVALASNNYENAFTPVTLPSLTHSAWLACLTNYVVTEQDQLRLLDGIGAVPRNSMHLPVPGLTVGDRIGAAVFGQFKPVDLVRQAARPVAVVGPDGLNSTR